MFYAAQQRHGVTRQQSHDKPTGDDNPDHGYEQDGAVKKTSEQNTAEEVRNQADFVHDNPNAEALSHRHRDAEHTLNERMSQNHSGAAEKWQDGLRRDDDK